MSLLGEGPEHLKSLGLVPELLDHHGQGEIQVVEVRGAFRRRMLDGDVSQRANRSEDEEDQARQIGPKPEPRTAHHSASILDNLI